MDKSASSQMNSEDVENPGSEINSCIEQLMTLRKLLEKSNKEIQYWRNQKSKLLESNYNIDMNLDKLTRNVSDIEDKISENTKIYIAKKQELRDLQITRTNTLHKQWNNCLSETGRYADDICQWITNYSKDVLTKEIKNHQKECEKVRAEMIILKQELNDTIRKCDSDYTEANNDLTNLNFAISNIRSGNNKLIKNIKFEEDALNKIQNKIKQSKIIINEYKMKEKTNAKDEGKF